MFIECVVFLRIASNRLYPYIISCIMIRIARGTSSSVGTALLARNFGSGVTSFKPFDFSQLGRDGPSLGDKREGGFSIESLLKNRTVNGATDGNNVSAGPNVGAAGAKPAGNRFASMFEKEKKTQYGNNKKTSFSVANRNPGSTNGSMKSAEKKPYNKVQGKPHHTGSKSRPEVKTRPHKRVVRFEFKTGSDQAQAALKAIIAKVHACNTNYKCKFIDQATGLVKESNLVDVANNSDLREFGLHLLPGKEGELPTIKKVTTREMLKAYSDELAAEREKALLESGSVAAQRALNSRLKAERKKSAAKVVTIYWNISLGDLKNQKKTELSNRLCKGEVFTIYMRKKGREIATPTEDEDGAEVMHVQDIRRSLAHDEDALNIELQRRELITETLLSVLDELPCTYTVEGQKENKLSITVTPKPEAMEKVTASGSCEELLSPKELKKQRQLQKQKEREEELKRKKQEKEDNLDSLYSFKIEN
ncbi:altered inheritance of mitochondria protein 23, mitochondrial [Scheffersomyces xylosifermentans]|uniref:altered inheritance of mitochondria protein 23, mitochondrial n=1 Tax=Scheffersomyces xylosifermentans TaxID=1304137 RepID=UPI00315DB87C